ncbi:MAG: dTDP-4-dehydrorhamnose 3,5-epimerase [Acidimicrobiia bacterium]
MEFRPQQVAGCYLIALEPHIDERGSFARAFAADAFSEAGLESTISQMNLSHSRAAGTIRGIHWQVDPHSEAKIVRCIQGHVFDVCVDVRAGSPTRGKWVGVELSAENGLALYIPPGCGHANQALEPESRVLYSTSAPYAPEAEMGARWDDPLFSIEWPLCEAVVISAKDRSWPDFCFE